MRTTIAAVALLLAPGLAAAAELHSAKHGQMHQDVMQHDGTAAMPMQPGQGAFAAIQEIVEILEADARTDWSKVNIERLRRHLIDMDNVTMSARVSGEAIPRGMRYTVTGDGAVADSIRRMALAHAETMDGAGGWHFTAEPTDDGAALLVESDDPDKIRALGFIGAMTRGAHHQEHHLMIARGSGPHE